MQKDPGTGTETDYHSVQRPDEIDYRINYPEPHAKIIETLEAFEDCRVMYGTGCLPADLSLPVEARTAGA